MSQIAKPEFIVKSKSKKWTLLWEDIGEGLYGEYNPNVPDDKPLFRASLLNSQGGFVDDGSYCTRAVIGEATEEHLVALSEALFESLGKSFDRSKMEMWTWKT